MLNCLQIEQRPSRVPSPCGSQQFYYLLVALVCCTSGPPLPSHKILRNAKLRNFAMTVGTRDSRKIIGRYNLTGALEEGQLQNHVAAVDMKLTVKSQERATSENYHQIHTLSLHCQPAWRLVPGQDVCNQARFEDAVGIFPEFIDGNLFDLQKVVGWPGGPGGSTQYTKSERG